MAEITVDRLKEIKARIETIFTSEMEVTDYTGEMVPSIQDLPDKNKGMIITNCTILFVDIRSSTKLSDKSQAKSMTKIYRAFARGMSMCIFSCGGQVRQIAGDRVMGVFVDDVEESSVHKAMNASRAILTVVEHIFNPLCKKNVNNKTIGCGVGIDTGRVLTASIGIKHDGEDTRDLVWAGKTANVASKHTDLAEAKEIFVTKRFYDKLSQAYKTNTRDSESWKKSYRIKGDTIFEGYGIRECYVDGVLEDEEIKLEEPSEQTEEQVENVTDGMNHAQIISSIVQGVESKVGNLLDRYETLIHRERDVNEKETIYESKIIELKRREDAIQKREEELRRKENQMDNTIAKIRNETKYDLKVKYMRENMEHMEEKDFWVLLKEIQKLGGKIGKSEYDCMSDLCLWCLVDYFHSRDELTFAFSLIINHLKNKISDVSPRVPTVVDVVKKLGREREYLEAVFHHVEHSNPSIELIMEFREIIKKLGLEDELPLYQSLSIESNQGR